MQAKPDEPACPRPWQLGEGSTAAVEPPAPGPRAASLVHCPRSARTGVVPSARRGPSLPLPATSSHQRRQCAPAAREGARHGYTLREHAATREEPGVPAAGLSLVQAGSPARGVTRKEGVPSGDWRRGGLRGPAAPRPARCRQRRRPPVELLGPSGDELCGPARPRAGSRPHGLGSGPAPRRGARGGARRAGSAAGSPPAGGDGGRTGVAGGDAAPVRGAAGPRPGRGGHGECWRPAVREEAPWARLRGRGTRAAPACGLRQVWAPGSIFVCSWLKNSVVV